MEEVFIYSECQEEFHKKFKENDRTIIYWEYQINNTVSHKISGFNPFSRKSNFWIAKMGSNWFPQSFYN